MIILDHKVKLLDTVNKCSSKLLTYYNDITRIYLSYKQCYSKGELLDKVLPTYFVNEEETDAAWERMNDFSEDSKHPFWSTQFFKNFKDNELICDMDLSPSDKDAYAREEIFNYFSGASYQLYNMIKMCEFIMKHKNHESPLEHGSASVQISNFPRILSQQITRHRIGVAISQQSQRYVAMGDEPMIHMPRTILHNKEACEIYKDIHEKVIEACKTIRNLNDPEIKDEDIRMLYTNAFCTELTYTMNFRAWMHFFEERCCNTAQHQTRKLANDILHLLQIHIPFLFDDAGPKCLRLGYCPEGREDKCSTYKRSKHRHSTKTTNCSCICKH